MHAGVSVLLHKGKNGNFIRLGFLICERITVEQKYLTNVKHAN